MFIFLYFIYIYICWVFETINKCIHIGIEMTDKKCGHSMAHLKKKNNRRPSYVCRKHMRQCVATIALRSRSCWILYGGLLAHNLLCVCAPVYVQHLAWRRSVCVYVLCMCVCGLYLYPYYLLVCAGVFVRVAFVLEFCKR